MSRFLKEALRAVEPYTPGEQPRGVQDLLKLNTNENPFPPSPMVQKALHSGEIARLNLYSDPNCADFLRVLADTLGVGCGQVLAGNGSDEVLQFAFSAFAEKGAAYPDITYGFYDVLSRFFRPAVPNCAAARGSYGCGGGLRGLSRNGRSCKSERPYRPVFAAAAD